jgi:hypothetical protein
MQYTVKELAADRFMLIAATGEPLPAILNTRAWAQRLADTLSAVSLDREIKATRPHTLER